MNTKVPDILSELADGVGGTIHECEVLSDGSGFATMSMPLPEDHWLHERAADGFSLPAPYPLLAGRGSLSRDFLEDLITPAVRYGVKAATNDGREEDFDPDALVRNVLNGTFGLWTDNGLTNDEDMAKYWDPEKPGSLKTALLEALSLALNDGLLSVEDVQAAITPEGVAQALERDTERRRVKEEEWQALCKRKGWQQYETQADSSDAPTPPDPEPQ